jgi:hypothetical protein
MDKPTQMMAESEPSLAWDQIIWLVKNEMEYFISIRLSNIFTDSGL